MITLHVETLADTLEEMKPCFNPHWAELALDQDKVPLDPQYEVYLAREAAGQVLLVVAREGGRLMAYFVGFIAPGLHYRTCLTLQMDIFWLHPEFREGDSLDAVERELLCDQILERVVAEAKARGVQRIFLGSKMHRDISAAYERLGFREVERYWSLWAGKE